MRSFMSAEEISRLVKALSELGVCKIRLIGGEPTVRKDFFDIAIPALARDKMSNVADSPSATLLFHPVPNHTIIKHLTVANTNID